MNDNSTPVDQLPDQTTPWYAVYTRPHHEKLVARILQFREVDCFLPLFETENRWHDRYKIIQSPLFPSYLFVHISPEERARVVMAPGVVCLVSSQGHPVPVPESEINAIRNYMSLRLPAEPYPYLAVGRRVRIAHGPLAGLQGVVLRQKNRLRVVITVDLIMRSMVVDVCAADLVPLPMPRSEAGRHCQRIGSDRLSNCQSFL